MNKQYLIKHDDIKSFIKDAEKLSFRLFVDVLPIGKFVREPADKSIDEVLSYVDNSKSVFCTLIYRNHDDLYFEAGLRVEKDGSDYFIWADVSIENAYKLIEKYTPQEL